MRSYNEELRGGEKSLEKSRVRVTFDKGKKLNDIGKSHAAWGDSGTSELVTRQLEHETRGRRQERKRKRVGGKVAEE